MRFALFVLVVAACSSADEPAAGGERASCRPGASCDVGLECWSEVCVRPPGADCGAVARRLASVTLGNYASDDDSRSVRAALIAQCREVGLTAREGRCLLAAADDEALSDCPRALLPSLDGPTRRCTPMGVLLQSRFAPSSGVQTALVDACIADRWAKPLVGCVGDATSITAVRSCLQALPGAPRRRLERKLDRAEQQASKLRVPPPDPWAAAGAGNLPPQCARYLELLDKYASCNTLPRQTRDALAQSADQMRSSWAGLPPDALKMVDDACKQGGDAMAQALTSMRCTP